MALLGGWHLSSSQCILHNDLNGQAGGQAMELAVARAGYRISDWRSGGTGGRPGGLASVNLLDRMVKSHLLFHNVPNDLVRQFVDRAPSSLGQVHCSDNFALQLWELVVATKRLLRPVFVAACIRY